MDDRIKLRLATIIDCEGSISIYLVKDGNQKYNKPLITVGQKNKEFLEQFRKAFGFGKVAPSGSNLGYWEWTVAYIQAYIVCKTLTGFFQLKQENADKIIIYYENRAKSQYYHLDIKTARYKCSELQKLQK